MDTLAALIYFACVIGALPVFALLQAVALARLSGWTRLFAFIPAISIGWTVVREVIPILVHWNEMDRTDLYRIIYERWSAESRPALTGSAVLAALLLLSRLRRLRDRNG